MSLLSWLASAKKSSGSIADGSVPSAPGDFHGTNNEGLMDVGSGNPGDSIDDGIDEDLHEDIDDYLDDGFDGSVDDDNPEQSNTSAFTTRMLDSVWQCLQDTPKNQKHVLYDEFLTSRSVLSDIEEKLPIVFADKFQAILQSESPPPIEELKSMPSDAVQGWGAYILVLEKDGHTPRVYVGSATSDYRGLVQRFKDYQYGNFPCHVGKSIEEGFDIVHKGMVCWTPSIPPPELRPLFRLLVVALESAIAYMLWAMNTKAVWGKLTWGKDYGMGHMSVWDRDALPYTGLCSHCALYEGVKGDFSLSAEQLISLAAQRRANTAAKQKPRNVRYHQRQMATNHREYIDGMAQRGRVYRAKNHEKVKARERELNAQHKEAKTYYCNACKTACHKKSDLAEHKKTKKHKDHVKALKKPPKVTRWSCPPCAYKTDKSSSWRDHCNSIRHGRLVADAQSEQLN